jgi:hypothetical protein
MQPAAVANMQYDYNVSVDGKKYPIPMGFPAVEQLAYLKRRIRIFRR